jgi:dihydrofolate synthase / folylpolyglutamate synthase
VFKLPKYGDGVCLARMAELLEAIGVDRARLSRVSVVVTGSNGKGSTAAFCAGIGRARGLRTGLFTSPHLYRFNERIQVDGQPIADEDLARLTAQIESAIAQVSHRRGKNFGSFEAVFAVACLYFQEHKCEFAVMEAGIGGRYDPVRLIGAPVTCVASIDYEHMELLGNSLELILSDKSDACASGGTIVYGENCRKFRSYLAEYLRYRAIDSRFIRHDIGIGGEAVSSSGQRFDFTFEKHHFGGLEMGLSGAFQFNNAAIAIALFILWFQRARPAESLAALEPAIRSGLRETRWPGRLEAIRHDPLTVIDVGHTPDAIRQSLESLKATHGSGDWVLVTGVSRDKRAEEIIGELAPSFATIICTAAHHRGAPPEEIAASAQKANPHATVFIASTVAEAVELSGRLATSLKRRIYVAGGLFLAVEYGTVARGGLVQDMIWTVDTPHDNGL